MGRKNNDKSKMVNEIQGTSKRNQIRIKTKPLKCRELQYVPPVNSHKLVFVAKGQGRKVGRQEVGGMFEKCDETEPPHEGACLSYR